VSFLFSFALVGLVKMETETFDLAIVGAGESFHSMRDSLSNSHAGIHGLTMLKTYRDVHPSASIVVLDKGTSIGGVWARDRLYPGLHTNNHFQTWVYSFDLYFTMTDNLQIRGKPSTNTFGLH
jgi:hypothetical protein